MPFDRHLNSDFVAALNELHDRHDRKDNWWYKLVNDPRVFIAIRNNSLNAYVAGGSVGRIAWRNRSIRFAVNHAYLVFPDRASRNPYIDLMNPAEELQPLVINGPADFVEHFKEIKRAVKTLSGFERQGENRIAADVTEVIDIEAAFDTAEESKDRDAKPSQGRIDLMAVDGNGKIVTTEAKLFRNSELRATITPAVCGQLVSYHQWLSSSGGEIEAAYLKVLKYYRELKGRFFRRRCREPWRGLSVDPIPRLLIFGFDAHQREGLKFVRDSICNGVSGPIPGFSSRHIRTVGGITSVRSAHIL